MHPEENTYCYYSDLPSPLAYMQSEENLTETKKEDVLNDLQKTQHLNSEEISKPSDPTTHA